jgi:DNA-binding response OmpR family regulator
MSPVGRILVIDDQPELRELLTHFLSSAGYDIVLCADGKSAAAHVHAGVFALVITDLRLPDMHGLDLLRLVKLRNPLARVAVMTGAGDAIDRKDAQRLGVDYLLIKPFTRQQLLQVVASALGQPVR